MTVVCWDGTTLAADKMADMGGLKVSVTKIKRIADCLVGSSGSASEANELMAWFGRGADPKDFPETQRDTENWTGLLVIKPDLTVLKYEHTPYPVVLDPRQQVGIGSGRDFAVAAMHLGADAKTAVEVASRLCSDCGLGVDTLTF